MIERIIEAVRNIFSYRLRALLTMLGIIFGLVAFITMLAIGAGAKQEILKQISSLGLMNIIIKAKDTINEQDKLKARSVGSMGMSKEDLSYLSETFPFIEGYSCFRELKKDILIKGLKLTEDFKLKAVDRDYFKLMSFNFTAGSDTSEWPPYTRGIILPERFYRMFFGNLNALGETVWIDRELFRIMGVFSPSFTGQKRVQDEKSELFQTEKEIYIPLDMLQYIYPEYTDNPEHHKLSGAVIKLDSAENMEERKNLISSCLKRRHGGITDVEIIAPLELLKKSQKTQEVFNTVMLIIASLSLLIGGIGIMNIMLANVMERTREIGIHRAIGATRFDIILNFLFESLILSSTGGIIGIVLGIIASKVVVLYTKWEVIISVWGIFAGGLISVLVGVFFGIYPAYRAAMVEPIEALRYE